MLTEILSAAVMATMPLATGDVPVSLSTTNVYGDGSVVRTIDMERIGPLACPYRMAGMKEWKVTRKSSPAAKYRSIRCESTKINRSKEGIRIKTHGWYWATTASTRTRAMVSSRPPKGVSLDH